MTQPLDRLVKKRNMRHLQCGRQAVRIDHKTMVLAGDLDLASDKIFDWMIGAAMTTAHFEGFGTKRQGHKLLTDTNAKNWHILINQLGNLRASISGGCSRITGAIG